MYKALTNLENIKNKPCDKFGLESITDKRYTENTITAYCMIMIDIDYQDQNNTQLLSTNDLACSIRINNTREMINDHHTIIHWNAVDR